MSSSPTWPRRDRGSVGATTLVLAGPIDRPARVSPRVQGRPEPIKPAAGWFRWGQGLHTSSFRRQQEQLHCSATAWPRDRERDREQLWRICSPCMAAAAARGGRAATVARRRRWGGCWGGWGPASAGARRGRGEARWGSGTTCTATPRTSTTAVPRHLRRRPWLVRS